MADLEALGDHLRHRRKMLGMRSRELARKAGVSQSYVWLIESTRSRRPSERRHLSRDVLVRWAAALDVERDELAEWLALADYDPTLTRDELAMIAGDRGTYASMLPERPVHYLAEHRLEPDELDTRALRNLQDRVRDTIVRAAMTDRHDEAVRLLESYMDWLAFYLAR